MNRRRQLQSLKKLSALEVGTYIPASECVGKQFAYGQYIYRVVQYHPRKATFTLEMVNAFNQHIEKDETFVRHHCTPPAPREITPCRYERPVFPEFPRSVVIPATIVQNEDIEHQPVDNKMTLTAELNPTIETDVDPAYYLDREFDWISADGTHFIFTVQAYNERRKQFRLYDIRPEARSGSFYRDAAFVYQHCQPAEKPIVREPMPGPTFNPYRFWNLVSLSDKRQIIAERVHQTGIAEADPLLLCACCGQPVMILGIQIWSAKMNRKDSILVECQNPDCIAHRRTATTESHGQICDEAKREKGESA